MANSASWPLSSMTIRATAPTRASPGGNGSAATRANSVFGLTRVRRSAVSCESSLTAWRKRCRTSSGSSNPKAARIGSASSGRIGRINTSRPLGRRWRSCQGGSRSRAAMAGYWHNANSKFFIRLLHSRRRERSERRSHAGVGQRARRRPNVPRQGRNRPMLDSRVNSLHERSKEDSMAGGGDSTRAIVFALGANFAIAVAKGVAAFFTGSSAMLAETVHSLADCGNQLLLLFGMSQAKRPVSPDYPLGYGKAIYFWSFLVAVMLFTIGGMFSLYEGIHKLQHPE